MDAYLTGISLGFFLSFMIGPVFFVLIETSLTKGFRAAISFDLGVVIADICFIAVAYFSSFRLIEKIKDEPALFLFGGSVMAVYGIISFVKLKKQSEVEVSLDKIDDKKKYLNLFAKGFLLNFINIGVLGFWLAILITIGPQLEMDPQKLLFFFASVVLSYVVTDVFKIVLAKQLRSKLTTKNIVRVKKVSSVLLIIFGFVIMTKAFIKSKIELPEPSLLNLEVKK